MVLFEPAVASQSAMSDWCMVFVHWACSWRGRPNCCPLEAPRYAPFHLELQVSQLAVWCEGQAGDEVGMTVCSQSSARCPQTGECHRYWRPAPSSCHRGTQGSLDVVRRRRLGSFPLIERVTVAVDASIPGKGEPSPLLSKWSWNPV